MDTTTVKKPSKGKKRSLLELVPSVIDKIVQYIKMSATYEIAGEACGIHPSTLKTWLRKGEQETDNSNIYRKFYIEVNEAIAQNEVYLVAQITNAAKTQWQAAAWILSKRNPKRWGRHLDYAPVDEGGANDKISITIVKATPQQVDVDVNDFTAIDDRLKI